MPPYAMANPEILKRARALPAFSTLPEERLKEVSERLELQKFSEKDVIFKEGDKGEHIYFIAEGRIDIEKHLGDGDNKLLAQLGASGDLVRRLVQGHQARGGRSVLGMAVRQSREIQGKPPMEMI